MATQSSRQDTDLDKTVRGLAQSFAAGLGGLAAGRALREGILRAGISYLIIALEDEFSDCPDVIEDELTTQIEVMRNEAKHAAGAKTC